MKRNLRALKYLNENVDAGNGFLVATILSKVASETGWQWELTLQDKLVPAYKVLLAFLEKRTNCLTLSSHKIHTPSASVAQS